MILKLKIRDERGFKSFKQALSPQYYVRLAFAQILGYN
jgi:hypothetical protein